MTKAEMDGSVPTGYRRRVTAAAFLAVASGLTGLFAAVTVAPLIANDITGSTGLSGIPTAAAIAGTAMCATVLSRIMAVSGRRAGLLLGFTVGALGAALAATATLVESFTLLVLGMAAVGAGNSSCLLARYAVADVHRVERRSSVVGLVIWAGTFGATAGPSLVGPAGSVAGTVGMPILAGGLVVTGLGFAAAAVICDRMLRPDPSVVTGGQIETRTREVPADREVWRRPAVRIGVAAMVAGQFVMVLIMTMTPLHVHGSGHGLGVVGTIMSLHVLGMYAFTPVAGWASDRLGPTTVILGGLGLLAVSGAMAASAPPGNPTMIGVALFVLGLGWSLGFVAASGILSAGAGFSARARIQGTADTLVFGAATVASLASGVLLAAVGFSMLCLIGAVLVGIPGVVVMRNRRADRLSHAVAGG